MLGTWSNIFLLGKKDMNDFHLNRVDQALFALVGSGLALEEDVQWETHNVADIWKKEGGADVVPGCNNGGEEHPSGIKGEFCEGVVLTPKEWEQCYKMACAQGVMAIAWDGVMKLPKELQPPVGIKIQWAIAVEKYEKQYLRYCRTIESLSRFYRENGIATVQMKGVGLSTYYPQPMHREGGDIDIYTYALESLCGNLEKESKDSVKKTVKTEADVKANALADELMCRQGIAVDQHSYKHSNFSYNSVPIENHKCFLNVKHYRYGAEVNGILEEVLDPQKRQLPLSEGASIFIPSLVFNAVFVPFHAFQHYGSGISLHHLCDWAMILAKGGLDVWPQPIRDRRFMTAIAAFTILSDELLGTRSGLWQESRSEKKGKNADLKCDEVKSAGVKIIESVVDKTKAQALANKMFREIMYPPYSVKEVPVKGKLQVVIYKAKRMVHRCILLKDVFETSLAKSVWESFVAHIKAPHTIWG